MVIQLLNNLAFLLALGILYSFWTSKWPITTIIGKTGAGILFGLICIVGMASPVQLSEGVVFDGRSVILAVGGIFGGPITALISALFAAAFRIYVGGVGVFTGVGVIITSSLLGVGYYRIHRDKTKYFEIWHIYLFGIIVHVFMILMLFTLPANIYNFILPIISLPVLILFPIATLFLVLILHDQEKKSFSNKALAKNEEILRLFVENSPAAIAMFDNEMRYIIASKRYLRDFNLGDRDIVGHSHYEIFSDIPDRWKEIHNRCLAGATESTEEDPFPRADGSLDWVKWEIIPWYENKNEIGGIILISEVITEKKTALDSLKESEKYNRTLFNDSIIGLAVAKLDGKLIDINQAYADIIGRTIEETKQLTYWDITPEKYKDIEGEQLKLLEKTGKYGPFEKEYVHKDGNLVNVRLQGLLIEREREKLILSSVEDITDRVENERILRENEQRLLSIYDSIGDILTYLEVESKNKYRFVSVNQSFYSVTGLNSESVIGKLVNEIIPEPSLSLVLEKYEEAIENKCIVRWEETSEYPTGTLHGEVSIAPVFDAEGRCTHLVGSVHDLTEKKKAIDKLQHQAQIMNQVHEAIIATDLNGVIVEWNIGAYRTFEYSAEEIIGEPITILYPENQLNILVEEIQPRVRLNEWHECEVRLIRKSGEEFPAFLSLSILKDSHNKVVGMTGTAIDLTERNEAQAALDKSEARHQLLFEHMLEAMAYHEVIFENGIAVDYVYLEVNKAFGTLTGLENVEGKKVSEVLPEIRESNPELLERFGRVALTGHPEKYETYVKITNTWFYTSLYSLGNNIVVSVFDNITERKLSVEKIKESETKFRALVEQSITGIYIFDEDKFLYVNKRFCEIFGYSEEEIYSSLKPIDMVIPEERPNANKNIRARLEGEVESVHYIAYGKHKEGKELWIEIHGTHILLNNKDVITGTVLDITGRKLAEEEIHRYENIVSASADLMAFLDEKFKYLAVNKAYLNAFNLTLPQIKNLTVTDVFGKEFFENVIEPQATRCLAGENVNYQEWFELANSSKQYLDVNYYPFYDGKGTVTGFIVNARDITERNIAEQKIRESEERLRLSTELGGVAVWDYDFLSNSMSRSVNHDTLYGLDWQTNWDINTFLNVTHPEDREYSNQIIQNSVAPGGPDKYSFDFRVVYPDESIHWLMVTGQVVVRNVKGEGIHVRGSLIDITKRKEAEQNLQKSEERFSKIFHNSPFSINLFRFSDGSSINVNDAFLSMTGYLREEILNHSAADLNLFVDQAQRNIWLNQIKEFGKAQIAETKIRKKDGEVIDVLGTIELIDINGEKLGLSMAIDVSENKKMQIELGKSKKQFKSIAENLPGVVTQYKVNPDGTDEHLYVSDGTLEIWGLPQEVVLNDTSTIWDMVDELDKEILKKSVDESFINLTPWDYEWRIHLPDNSIKWLQGMGIPQKYEDGSVVWDTMILDITRRKQMEEQLEQTNTSLRELFVNLDTMREEERKKVARELHDELGQVITSIKMNLSLLQNSVQTDRYDKDDIISEINEMQNIIDISKENIKDLIKYLRPEFLDNLGIIVALNHIIDQTVKNSELEIDFNYNFENIKLKPEVENTIFRIIQEAVTNIIKHSKATKVKIDLQLNSDILDISVSDNGIGILSSDLRKKNSLGLVGIEERLKILGSKLELDHMNGTTLKFSLKI